MMSIFFTYNLLWIDSLTIVSSYIEIRIVLPEIWKAGGQIDLPPPPPPPPKKKNKNKKTKKLPSKTPALLGLKLLQLHCFIKLRITELYICTRILSDFILVLYQRKTNSQYFHRSL